MIRINLLGAQKGKNKRSAASAAAVMEVGDVGSPKLKVLVVLVLAALVNVGYWYQLDKEHRDIAAKMEVAMRKNAELADVKARYLERQREAENYKRRVDVIDQLRAAQAGPVDLLNTVGQTVNNTEAVWLNSMKDQGASIDIDGMALSTDAVASLISNLQKTGHFTNIEINFTLTCEKAKS
jgi:Tfp pilus assembly protein PilN